MDGVTDKNLTYNHFKLDPGGTQEVRISWNDIEALQLANHYFLIDDNKTYKDDNGKSGLPAIKFYHVAKRPKNNETGVELNEYIVHVKPIGSIEANPVDYQIKKGKTYYIEIYKIDDDIANKNDIKWNPGTSSSYPIKQGDSTDTYVKFMYQDGTCASATLKRTKNGTTWEDSDYNACPNNNN